MSADIQIQIAWREANRDWGKPQCEACAAPVGSEWDIHLAKRFFDSCQTNSDCVAVATGDLNHSYNYIEIELLVRQFANSLSNHQNFQVGDHVGVWMDNCVQYIVAFYGTVAAGGVVVPLPAYETRDKIDWLSNIACLKFLATKPGENTSQLFSLDSCFKFSVDDNAGPCPAPFFGGDHLAMLMFTSGSTGDSKAVMLSHRNLLTNCDSICQFLPIDSTDRSLVVTPFCHALGNSVLQTHLLNGASIVVGADAGFVDEIIFALDKFRCTNLAGVPEIFRGLAEADWGDDSIGHLKFMAVAGGALDANRARQLSAKIAPAKLFVMYGQTEATARLAYLPPEDLDAGTGTIGGAIPGVELEIRGSDGQPVGVGETGTLFARGSNIMLGYWNDEVATNEAIVKGWLCTGDLAQQRSDGRIQLCGRGNELVKIQGYRFHPGEVEQRISMALPQLNATVVAFEFYGSTRLAIFVVAGAEEPISPQLIRQTCQEVLPKHMVPQRYTILDHWPINSAGKVDRLRLVQSLASDNTNRKRKAGGKIAAAH